MMITSVSDDISKKRGISDYEIVYNKLNHFIDKVNEKIVSRIQLVQQVYLDDYKQQVSLMATELKQIRGVLDDQLLRQRSNQRLFYLQEERDFFRAQVIKLNEQLKKMTSENEKLKGQLNDTKHESQNYRKITYQLETRIYKLTYENLQMDKLKESTHKHKKQNDRYSQRQRDSQKGKDYQKTMHTLRLKPSQSVKMHERMKQTWTPQASKREQILQKCIKEVKKQIYYRTLNVKQSQKIHFDESKKISFDNFTKTDRKQLIYKMMSEPNIIEDFYQFVFQKKSGGEKLQKLALMRNTDAKFNTKSLLKSKTQFNKKIFDLKVNHH